MNTIVLILIVLWSIRLVRNTLAYAALWFLKEYRFDRMKIHLAANPLGRVLFPQFRIPPKSPKALLIVAIPLLTLVLVLFAPGNILVHLLVFEMLHFAFFAALVVLLGIPTAIVHRKKIADATALLRAKKRLLVIGITGSFGKTSVKDYAAAILSSSFSVLKTAASRNSAIGIAEETLRSLDSQEIFVAEMGAYMRGEIAQMAAMVRPQIGVVTAINAQHQDLFGSIDNTMKAKYELVAGLRGRSLAILNADDARIRTMGTWAKRDGMEVWWYTRQASGVRYHVSGEKTFIARNITSTKAGIEFDCILGDMKAHVMAPVVGEHQASNILAAIAVSVASGMTLPAAARAASSIVPAGGVLTLRSGRTGATFIDDTFNNNPDAAQAALDVLAKYPGKKILVFQPMIELGAYAKESHRDVGAYAGRICDRIILTNASWQEDFVSGVAQSGRAVPVTVLNPVRAATEISSTTRKGDAVLFKGKEAGLVLRAL